MKTWLQHVDFFQLGPNVSIGPNVVIGAGTRVRESIILANSVIGEHSLILYTVMGMNTKVSILRDGLLVVK